MVSIPPPQQTQVVCEYFCTKQAATYLGVSTQWLEMLRSRGGDAPPALRLNRRVRYHRASLDAWMSERKLNNSSKTPL